jgi:hypothetical protein
MRLIGRKKAESEDKGEEIVKAQAKEIARAKAEEKAKAEEIARAEAKAKALAQQIERAKAEQQARAEEITKANAAEKARAGEIARAEAKAKAMAEEIAKAKAEEESKAKEIAKAEAMAKAMAEEIAKSKAEEKAKAKELAKAEAKAKAIADEVNKAKAEQDAKKKAKAEEIAKEWQEKQRIVLGRIAKAEAEEQGRAEEIATAEAKAEALAKEIARAKAELAKAKEEISTKAKQQDEHNAEADEIAKAWREEQRVLQEQIAKAKVEGMAASEEIAKAEAKTQAVTEDIVRAKAEHDAAKKARDLAEEIATAKAEQQAQAEEIARVKAEEKAKAEEIARAEAEAMAMAEEIAKAKTAEEFKAREMARAEGKAEAETEGTSKGARKMPSLPTMQVGGRMTGTRITALSIEGTDLRLVSFHKGAIQSWDSVSFDPQLLKMGQVGDAEGLGAVIKSALEEKKEVSKSQVVCSPPGLRAVSRIITVPKAGMKELEGVVTREVRRLMTVSEADNYIHWYPLPIEGDRIPIFVLVVPKEPILAFTEALSIGGVRPRAIDLKPLALIRAVNQKDAVIANGESNSMELIIVVDDVPVLIRNVFLGEGVVTEDYAVGRISDELRRTIVTYNEINKDSPLDPDVPIFLSGATASSMPFALNVAALTGRTVQPLEPPIPYPDDFPVADFMVNLGLILKIL